MICSRYFTIRVGLLFFVAVPEAQVTAQVTVPTKARQAQVILGVLEDNPGKSCRDSDTRAVRVVFQKVGDDWRAFPTQTKSYHDLETLPESYPKEVAWTIAFSGRDVGQLTAQTPPQFSYYSDIGIQCITSHGPVPTFGKKSTDYAGFGSEPVYRPLVALSQPNFEDPQRWKRGQPSPELIAAVRQQFRSRFPRVSNCENPYQNVPKTRKYRDEDIHVIRGYSSRDDWSLIQVKLTGYACDGPIEDGGAFDGQWYVVGPSGELHFLASGMQLVDAGDYDKSGESQVLFSIERYNTGGYRLFYRQFARSVQFLFHYH